MSDYLKKLQRKGSDPGNESGFTLIELLIVIVVLGILAAVVVFALGGVTGNSVVAACNADAKTVEIAVGAFDAQVGSYPTTQAELTTPYTPVAGGTTFGPYLNAWPNNTGSDYVISLDATPGQVDVALT